MVLKISKVCEMTSLSKPTIYRLINRGVFPKQIKLSIRSSGWYEQEVVDWIKSRRYS